MHFAENCLWTKQSLARCIISKVKSSTKPKNVDYFRVPRPLWRRIKIHLPKPPKKPGPGRPRADNRAVVNGIWYVLWTGCQWKAVHREWFGVSSSVLHERFQTWQQQGIWEKVMRRLVRFYSRQRRVRWKWQAIDSKSVPSPWAERPQGVIQQTEASVGPKCISWSTNEGHHWRSTSAVPISTINGLWTTSSSRLLSPDQQANSTCAWTKHMMRLTSTSWCLKPTTKATSATAGAEANRCQSQYQMTINTRPVVGSWSARSAGWQNVAVSAPAGAKSLRIGSPLFSSRALISCAI